MLSDLAQVLAHRATVVRGMLVCMHAGMYVRTCVCMYVCMYVCILIYMRVYAMHVNVCEC